MKTQMIQISNRIISTGIAVLASVAILAAPRASAQNGPDTWVGNTSANLADPNWTGANNPPINGDSWMFGAAGGAGAVLNNTFSSGIFVSGITFNSGASAFTFTNNNNVLTLVGNITNNSAALQTFTLPINTYLVDTLAMNGGGLTLGGTLTGLGGGLTTAGSGTLTLSGTDNLTGANIIGAGTTWNPTGVIEPPAVPSSATMTIGNGPGNAILNIASTGVLSNYNYNIGAVAGAVGAVYLNGGILTGTQGSSGTDFQIGSASGAFGYVYVGPGAQLFCNEIGVGGENNPSGNGIFEVNGGSVYDNGYVVASRGGSAQTDIINVYSGLLNFGTNLNDPFSVNWGVGQTTVINLLGGTITTGPASLNQPINLNENGGTVNGGNTGILNLNGGTAIVGYLTGGGTNGTTLVNFNGGTLQADENQGTLFSANFSAVNVYGNGGTINNAGFVIAIAAPFLAPTGNGLSSIAGFTPGAGYIAPPVVTVVPGAGDTTGVGATAIAQINPTTGVVTNVIITSHGFNYTATPTFVVTGGGATTPATITGAAPTPNTSGGMTFTGSGITTINVGTNTNTYTGPTTLAAGTLIMDSAFSGPVVVNAGTMDVLAPYPGPTTVNGGTLNILSPYAGATILNGGLLNLLSTQPNIGAITVGDAATLSVTASGSGQLAPTTLTLGSSVGATVALSVSSTTLAPLTPATLDLVGANKINIIGGTLAVGSYPLITAGAVTGSGTLVQGTLPNGVTGSISQVGNTWTLTITAIAPTIWTGAAGAAGAGNWDTTSVNWTVNSTASTYTDGSPVQFNDTVANTNITVVGTVSPGGITVNNSAENFVLTTGIIAGSGGLTKSGSDSLTLSGQNTYTGPTVINAGSVIAGVAGLPGTNGGINVSGALGRNSTVTIANNATAVLNLNGFSTQIGSLSGGSLTGTNVLLGSGTLTLGGDNSSQTFSGVISGSGGLTQVGTGSLTLANTNSFTGGMTISGTLTLGSAAQLGSQALGTYVGAIVNKGVFNFNSSLNETNTGVMSGIGSLNVNGTGVLTLSNANTYSGPTVINTGARVILGGSSGGNGGIGYSAITVNTGGELDLQASDSLGYGAAASTNPLVLYGTLKKLNNQSDTLGRPITMSGGTITSTNIGVEQFNFYSNYIATVAGTANTITGAGYFGLRNPVCYFNVGSASTLTISCAVDQNINSNNTPLVQVGPGTLTLTATSNTFNGGITISNGTVTVASTGWLNNGTFDGPIINATGANFNYDGANIQVFSGPVNNAGTITVNSPSLVTFDGPISGTGTLTSSGTGTLALYGANSYSGLTTINSGKLLVNASQTSTGPVTIKDGATMAVVAAGSSQFSPATLSLGSSSGAAVQLTLSSTTVAPLNPGTLNLTGNNTFAVTAGSSLAAGSYPVLSYTTLSGSGTLAAANFSAPTGVTGTFSSSSAAGVTTWSLTVTAVAPSIATTWTGAVNGTWDISTTANWKTAGTAGVYANGSPVLFDDTDNTAGIFTITNVVAGVTVSPAGVVVNTTHGYAFGGTVTIAGVGGLTLTGPGTVTNSGLNTYTGPTAINSGVLMAGAASVGDTGPFGLDSAVSLANVAGVGLNLSGNSVAIGSLAGGGSLGGNVTLGLGTLTLGGDGTSQTFAGGISGSGGLNQIGGSLTLTSTNTFSGPITLTGHLTLGGATGQLGAAGVYPGLMTNNGVFSYNSATNETNSGVIYGTGSLVVNGPGKLVLTAAPELMSGTTTVNGGILTLQNSSGGNGCLENSIITVNAGGELDLNASDALGYGVSLPITIYGTVKKLNNQSETLFRPIIMSGGTLTCTNPGVTQWNFFGNYIQTVAGTANFISGPGFFGLRSITNYFNVGSGSTLTISEGIYQYSGGAPVIQTGPGTLILTGVSNTWTAGIIVSNGTVAVNSPGSLGEGNFVGPITNYASFNYNSSASQIFSGAISNRGTITFNSPAFVLVQAPISGPGALTQSGLGTTLLYSNTSYTGLTTINAGKLVVFSSQTNTSPVTVNDGGTLAVYATSGATTGFSPATLNLGSTAGAAIKLLLNSTTHAPLTAGTLNLAGNNTISVVAGSSLVAGQHYPVLSYTTLTGPALSAANFTLPPGVTGTFTASGNLWTLNVATVTTPPASTWTGVVNNGTYGTWDINTTANWTTSGSSGVYLDGSPVLFDDTASIFNVGGVGIVSPLSVAFNNSAHNYGLLNSLEISGVGGITLNGTDYVTNSATAFYSGPTVINQGTFVVAGGSTGVGPGPLGYNSTVSLANAAGVGVLLNGYSVQIGSLAGGGPLGGNVTNGGGNLTLGADGTSQTYGGNITGTGGLTMIGTGSLALTATNTFTGLITIGASNTLTLSGNGIIGTAGNTGYIYPGGIVDNGMFVYSSALTLTNSGVISGGGGMIMNGPGTFVGLGSDTFTNNLVINGGIFSEFYAVGNAGTSGFGSTAVNGRTVTVNNGGIASIDPIGGNAFGGGTGLHNLVFVVNKGGLMRVTSGNDVFTNIIINGGTVLAAPTTSVYGSAWATFDLAASIIVGGTSPSTISASSAGTTSAWIGYCLGVNQGAGYQTPFIVAPTGSSLPDLTVSASLYNSDSSASATGFNKSGAGTMALTGANWFTGPITITQGTLILGDPGTLNAPAYGGNIANNGAFIFSSAQPQTLTGIISGTGPLIVSNTSGPGLTISNANTYTGPTIIGAGTLFLAGTASINVSPTIAISNTGILDVTEMTSGYTMGSSQTLEGFGKVNGSVTTSSSALIEGGVPGTFGTLTFNNNLTMSPGASFKLGVGTSASGLNSQVLVTGTLTGNATTLRLSAPSGATLDSANYTLVTAGSIVGSFSPAAIWDNPPVNLNHYYVTNIGNSVLLAYTVTPEPVPGGTATPGVALRNQSVLVTVTVTPGVGNVTNVTVNASSVGGSASLNMVPNGVANTFTNTLFIAPSILPGAYNLSIVALDDVGAVGGGIALVTVGASTEKWAGVGANGNFDTAANWAIESGETAAYAPGYVGDSLDFAGTVGLSPIMDNSYSVNGVVFTNGAGLFNITATTGNSLTLVGAGVTNFSTNLETLSLPVISGITGQEIFNTAGGSLTIAGGLADENGGFTVIGSNVFKLAGANTYTGPVTVRQGTMTLAGTTVATNQVVVAPVTGSNAILNVVSGGNLNVNNTNGGQYYGNIIVTAATNAAGVLTLTNGGTITTSDQLNVGNGAGGYAYFNMSGGTANLGSYLVVAFNGDHSQFDMSGGNLTIASNLMTIGAGGTNSTAVANISGGTFSATNYTGANLLGGIFVGENFRGTLNVSGTAVVNAFGATNVTIGRDAASIGMLNLLGGTIVTAQVGGGAGASTFNFNGGMISNYGNVAYPTGVSAGPSFMYGINNTYVYPGGAFIDDGGNGITISEPLQAPTGYGVASISLVSGGSGYIAPPIVTISGGTGTNASAIAKVSGGAVTGLTIVNPGTGYSVADVLTVSFYGGGVTPTSGASATNGTPTLVLNGSGGLTKSSMMGTGNGTLTLTAPESYTNATIIKSGSLALGVGGAISNSASIIVSNGAVFDTSSVGGFTLGNGQSLLGGGTVNGAVTAASGSRIYPGADPATGTLTLYEGLTMLGGATASFDLSSIGGTTVNNDQLYVYGSVTLENNTIHIKAPSISANLDTANPYTLIVANGGLTGLPSTTPTFDVKPANFSTGNWLIQPANGNSVVLINSSSTPPGSGGSGSATPVNVIRNQNMTVTVTAAPGSSGAAIQSVQLDLTAFGGSLFPLTQQGTSHIWSGTVLAPAGLLPGTNTVAAVAYDGTLYGPVPVPVVVITTTDTWNGGDTVNPNSQTDDNKNWVSGGAPGYVGDSVIFAGSTGLTPQLDQAYTFNGLGFANGAGAFVINTSGQSLTLVNGATNNSANVETLNVPINLPGNATTFNAANGSIVLSGGLTGAGQLNVSGVGGVTLNAAASYVGNTTINAGGDLIIGPTGQWQNNLGQEVYAGTITNNGILTYDGSGNQTNTGIISGGGSLVVNSGSSGSSLDLDAYNTFSGGTTVNNGAILNLHLGGGAGTIQSSLTINPGATVNTWVQDSMGYTVGTCVPTLYIIGGTFANQFANNQSFNTQWYMTGGTVTTIAVPQGDGIDFNTGFGITTYATNVSVLFNAPIVIRGTGLTFNIAKGTVPGGVDMICNSNINGGSYIVMSGAGTLQLNDTNSFTGGVQINGGELQVGIAEQPGVGSPLGSGTISFGGGSLQYSAANQYDYSGRFSTTAGQLFSIDTAGQSVTLGTNLSSSGGTLTKLGLGTLTLTAANGYTGLTTVSNGTLLLATGSSIASSSGISIAAGATFDVSALPSPYTFASGSSVIGSGTAANPATFNSAGTVALGSIPVTLNYDSTDPAPQPALNISGNLSLGGNAFTINTLSGSQLAAGTYVVAQASGTITSSGTYPAATGTAVGSYQGTISISGNQVLLTIVAVNQHAPPIQFSRVGNVLTLSWPTNSGWTLQSNSINVAVPGDWFSIPGSSAVTTFPININTAKTNVFYRLYLP